MRPVTVKRLSETESPSRAHKPRSALKRPAATMALSVGATWGITSGAAAITFAIGTIVVIVLVRRRHRQLIAPARGLARGLSTFHRNHLSVDGSNYEHVAPPRTLLRRSTHLPYGVISEGWTDHPSHESIGRPLTAVIFERQGAEAELAQPKRLRSLRATFSPHSFHVPKTRRQKKIDKAIPLNAVGRSPLSAITEFSDPNPTTRDASPAIGAVELPTEITPTTTPPRPGDMLNAGRPFSTQWPLRVDKRRSQDVMPTATGYGVDRNSSLMRINSTGHSIDPSRVSLGRRSISMASTISVAPGDPLPPLPTIFVNRHPQRNNSRVRSSVASTDTVGSSVLGTAIFSASHDGTEDTELTVESPRIALSPSLLHEYGSRPESWGPTAVTMGTPPGTQTSRGLRNGGAGIGSFRASIGNPLSRITSTSQAPISSQYDRPDGLAGPILTAIDQSGWDSGQPARGNTFRKSLSPSLPAPVNRYGLPHQYGKPAARHSMYEQHIGIGKISFNANSLREASGDEISPTLRPSQPRPASVGTSKPIHWDQNLLSTLRNVDLNKSPTSQRRGHKRQNCVRISNLPPTDGGWRARELPQTAEEEEQLETPKKQRSDIPGLSLVQEKEDVVYKLVPSEGPPSPSPFRNKPTLNPTSRSWQMPHSRGSNRESSGSPRPDSDVFSASPYDPKTPNIFSTISPDRQWPLSATPLNSIKLNATPPSTLKPISEPYDPDSPILPSPTLVSATLFPRKFALHGPRTQPTSARSSRAASPSPLQRMSRNANTSTIATKHRSGDGLRRSVMLLGRMNSDVYNGSQGDRVSKIYRNMANEYAGSFIGMGSRSPSVANMTRSPSPTQEDDSLAPLPSMTTEKRLTTMSTLPVGAGGSVRHSNSRMGLGMGMGMGHSGSMVSNTGASIWEDASVRGDSPEPELPVLEEYDDETPKAMAMVDVDLEAYENLVGRDRPDRARESRLTSPQGKGLGLLGLDGKVWGTPASLYDREGFLKE